MGVKSRYQWCHLLTFHILGSLAIIYHHCLCDWQPKIKQTQELTVFEIIITSSKKWNTFVAPLFDRVIQGFQQCKCATSCSGPALSTATLLWYPLPITLKCTITCVFSKYNIPRCFCMIFEHSGLVCNINEVYFAANEVI